MGHSETLMEDISNFLDFAPSFFLITSCLSYQSGWWHRAQKRCRACGLQQRPPGPVGPLSNRLRGEAPALAGPGRAQDPLPAGQEEPFLPRIRWLQLSIATEQPAPGHRAEVRSCLPSPAPAATGSTSPLGPGAGSRPPPPPASSPFKAAASSATSRPARARGQPGAGGPRRPSAPPPRAAARRAGAMASRAGRGRSPSAAGRRRRRDFRLGRVPLSHTHLLAGCAAHFRLGRCHGGGDRGVGRAPHVTAPGPARSRAQLSRCLAATTPPPSPPPASPSRPGRSRSCSALAI